MSITPHGVGDLGNSCRCGCCVYSANVRVELCETVFVLTTASILIRKENAFMSDNYIGRPASLCHGLHKTSPTRIISGSSEP
jgi:hypothetical protein